MYNKNNSSHEMWRRKPFKVDHGTNSPRIRGLLCKWNVFVSMANWTRGISSQDSLLYIIIIHYMYFFPDTRVRGWFMLDSYLPTFFLTVIYLLSIWLGTKYMRNRPALSLRGILTLYNLGITLLSAYMLVEVSVYVTKSGVSNWVSLRLNHM
jgi:hypothetical protein